MGSSSHPFTLTSGPIVSTLMGLSAPMLIGILSMMSFNLIDAYFVGKLGTAALAALTLTFPVSMVIATFALGLGVGAMAAISRSIGEGDRSRITRYATDSLTLTMSFVVLLTGAGLATVDPLFHALGATNATMPFVKQYMSIWYPGMIAYVVPMIGGNVMRATGDTLTPSALIVAGTVLNIALDPLFIFGLGPFGGMGIAGAAVASVTSRGLMLLASLWILHFRQHILAAPWPGLSSLAASWKTILSTGLTVAVSNAVIPVATGIITGIVSRFGAETVAGFGVATRIEALGFAVVIALSTGISPFAGQNYGARNLARVRGGLRFAKRFSLAWGMVLLAAFLGLGAPLAGLFTQSPAAVQSATLYLWIVAASLGLRGVHQIVWTTLNVLNRPAHSLILEVILAFGLWVPLAFLGAASGQVAAVYAGLCGANIVAGIIAHVWSNRVLDIEDSSKVRTAR